MSFLCKHLNIGHNLLSPLETFVYMHTHGKHVILEPFVYLLNTKVCLFTAQSQVHRMLQHLLQLNLSILQLLEINQDRSHIMIKVSILHTTLNQAKGND